MQQLQDTLNPARAYTDTVVATGGTNAAAYTDALEAIIRRETAQAGHADPQRTAGRDAQTLSAANSWTDARFSQIVGGSFDALDARMKRFEDRPQVPDERISRLGALTAAMAQMGANASAATAGRGRLSVGAAGTTAGRRCRSATDAASARVRRRRSARRSAATNIRLGFGLDL